MTFVIHKKLFCMKGNLWLWLVIMKYTVQQNEDEVFQLYLSSKT